MGDERHGNARLVGFAYPPRARQAMALVQSTSGVRGACYGRPECLAPMSWSATQLYASTHPRQVAGLVLREAMTPPHRLLDPQGVDIWTSERQTRVALRRELAQLVPGGRLVIAKSGHHIQDEQPELVLDANRDVVQAVRAGPFHRVQSRVGIGCSRR